MHVRITNDGSRVTLGTPGGPLAATRLILGILITLASAMTGWAQNYGQALPLDPSVSSRLYRTYGPQAGPIVELGSTVAAHALIRDEVQELEPRVGVETLLVAQLPQELRELAESDPEALRLRAYNALNRFRSMTGIEYYSASRDRMRIYLHDAYRVDDARSRRPVPDPGFEEIEDEHRSYLYQHDSSFGRNVYEVVVRQVDDALWMRLENQTAIFYSIAPVMGARAAQIHLVLEFTEGRMQFYAHMGMDVTSLFGMDGRVQDSFTNRLLALYAWFTSQLLIQT